jgi:hypothetical protein
MRLEKHIKQSELLIDYLYFMDDFGLDESISDHAFNAIRNFGLKLGIKVKRSDTIFKYLKDAGKDVQDLVRLASIYLSTDVSNKKFKKEVTQDAKKIVKSVDKKEIAAFMLQMDKASVGLTSHIRHIMQSIFGLEVTIYSNWKNDIDYMKSEIKHIKHILKKMDAKEEMKTINKLENMILNMEKM